LEHTGLDLPDFIVTEVPNTNIKKISDIRRRLFLQYAVDSPNELDQVINGAISLLASLPRITSLSISQRTLLETSMHCA
jgi:hypothetical protein